MPRFLIDANVVSELRKPRPNAGVIEWFAGTNGSDLFLSALTIGELRYGIDRLRRRDTAQAQLLEQWLTETLGQFGGRITGVDPATAEEWGRLRALAPLHVVDGLLAATALLHEWTLVTRNVRDVEQTGCLVLNPFT